MSFPYAVVQFPKEGLTYSEIPTSWLTKDLTQCRWPATKNATFFIKKNSPPEADWLLFDVKVECYCETLEKARKKAEDINYATSSDEIRGRGKRIVHEKQFDDTFCDDSADDDFDSPPQLCKTPHKKLKIDKSRDLSGKKSFCDTQFSHKKQFSCEKVSQIAAEKSFSTPNRSLRSKSQPQIVDPQAVQLNDFNESLGFEPEKINVQNFDFISTSSPLATVADIEKLIPICIETLKFVKSIDKRLKVLERGIINVEEPMNIFDDILPINSIQNLKRFEENMETAETRANFIEFMKKVGGKGNKNIVQRCMSRLFTNEFGIACSWCGRGNNYRMCDLKCIRILKGVLRAKGVDECDFETVASEWFRLSKLRHDRENKKTVTENNDTKSEVTFMDNFPVVENVSSILLDESSIVGKVDVKIENDANSMDDGAGTENTEFILQQRSPTITSVITVAQLHQMPVSASALETREQSVNVSTAVISEYHELLKSTTLLNNWGVTEMRERQDVLFAYSIMRVKNGVDSPVAQKSVILDTQGKLHYYVYGNPVDENDTDLVQFLNNTVSLPIILERFQHKNICSGIGNINVHCIPEQSAFCDYVDGWRANKCSLLSKTKRCDHCNKLRRTVLYNGKKLKSCKAINRVLKSSNPIDQKKFASMKNKLKNQTRKAKRTKYRVELLMQSLKNKEAEIAAIQDQTLNEKCSALNT